ncbi:hypothetical protein C2869_04245 [Saccharobesus litoralis]|uniref:Carrier domain-containing protein n=1 Tax=Saccharobesus litoralis TaxID=2172099 RepID=A0A2S0VNB5_9ALTE|nr:non-ribosomal peptide synthetase [Saccharobesus litoralis]AWB65696.1 hypothetical protein C2869_04245 [Saccharobesus litoralis]
MESLQANPNQEQSQLVGRSHEYNREWSVIKLFKQIVAQHSQQVALSFAANTTSSQRLTYQQLDELSDCLACELITQGVELGDHVALAFDKGLDYVVAVLATLKAGAVFVPIDPEYPAERIATMLEISQSQLILSDQKASVALANANSSARLFNVSQWWQQLEYTVPASIDSLPMPVTKGQDPAYLLFTSGTTGKPKGVVNGHQQILNLALHYQKAYQVGVNDVVSQIPSFSFDASIGELFSGLLNAAHVVIFPSLKTTEPKHLVQLLADKSISVATFSPTALEMVKSYLTSDLKAQMPTLRIMLVGGEPFPVGLAKHYLDVLSPCRLVNIYGPTETTVYCTAYEIESAVINAWPDSQILPIGQPVANSELVIASFIVSHDTEQDLVVLDVHTYTDNSAPENSKDTDNSGEILIAGDCVSQGYFGLSEQTSKAFIKLAGKTYYRTGDLGSIDQHGNATIVGRADQQVKINGMRVELGEIRELIKTHNAVQDAFVVYTPDSNQTKRLVAYLVVNPLAQQIDTQDIAAFCHQNLPKHMVPFHYQWLDEIPMTTSGKVDKARLPDIEWSTSASTADGNMTVSSTAALVALCQAMAKVLNVAEVTAQDNFYLLGGDSVSALRLASALNDLGFAVSQSDIGHFPQVGQLVTQLKPLQQQAKIDSRAPTTAYPLAPIQLWFTEQNFAEPSYYHQSMAWQIEQAVNLPLLQQAVNTVVKRHEQLLSIIDLKQQQQTIDQAALLDDHSADPLSIQFVDLCSFSREHQQAQIAEISQGLRRDIRLDKPMHSIALCQLAEQSYQLIWVMHHALVDTVSWYIISKDLQTCYQALIDNKPAQLVDKTSAYASWVLFLSQLAEQDDFVENYLPLWQPELAVSNKQIIRAQQAPGLSTTASLQRKTVKLTVKQSQQVVKLAREYFNASNEELALAAVYRSLSILMARSQVCLDVEWHGRQTFGNDQIDLNQTVGWFTSIFPLAVNTAKGQSLSDTLLAVKEAKRAKICNGASFGVLRYLTQAEKVNSERVNTAFADYQASDVIFNYSGVIDTPTDGWQRLDMSAVESHADNRTPYELAIEAFISHGELHFELYFHQAYFDNQSANLLADLIVEQFNELTTTCESLHCAQRTPSDFPLAKLSTEELATLPANLQNVLPLSDIQSGIYLQSVSAPDSQMYQVQVVYQFNQAYNLNLLQQAWQIVIARHPALRTQIFASGLSHPVQGVLSQLELAISEVDLRAMSAEDIDLTIADYLALDGQRGFGLEAEPLLRLTAFPTHSLENRSDSNIDESEQFRLLLSVHHLIHDGWSLAIVLDEVAAIYASLLANKPVSLPPVTASYVDYIVGQQQVTQLDSTRYYWQQQVNQLINFERVGLLSDSGLTNNNAGLAENKSQLVTVNIGDGRYQQLQQLAKQQGVTLNTVTLTAFLLLLRVVKQQNQINLGLITSGRTDAVANSHSIVGCCLNTLPYVAELNHDLSVAELLQLTHKQMTGLLDNCLFPLSEVANMARQTSGDYQLTELFDCTYDFESYRHVAAGASDPQAQVARPQIVSGFEMTNYGLELNVIEEEAGLSLRLTYAPDQFKASTVKRWANYLQNLLAAMTSCTVEHKALALEAVSHDEQQQIKQFAGFSAPYPDQTIYQFVEQYAQQTPNALAIRDDKQSLTYLALNNRVNQFSRYLKTLNVAEDQPVAIVMERSVDMVVAILAVWKVGAAYMPVEPSFPIERIDTVINNARCAFTLIDQENSIATDKLTGVSSIIRFDLASQMAASLSTENINLPYRADYLAYVLFTSGSTGTPKGVMIEHAGMMNNIQSEVNDFYLDSDSVIAQTASQCFDVSVWQLFSGFVVGAKTVIYNKALQLDAELFIQQCFINDKVTNLQLVPSYITELFEYLDQKQPDLSHLRMLSITGEALKYSLLEQWMTRYPNIPVVNAYGPAEASDDISHHTFTELPADKIIPIGKPTQNANIYVLDEQNQPCPIGAVGEICVSGICVGRGYINDATRTAAVFAVDPFILAETGDTVRMYRTGDLGRWREDGILEFYGRKDHQVKVNGFRIELGEIDNHLADFAQIHDVAVVVQANNSGGSSLVAWYSAEQALDTSALRQHMLQRVPSYMVPHRFNFLAELPTNNNGKIDRKILAKMAVPQAMADSVKGNLISQQSSKNIDGAIASQAMTAQSVKPQQSLLSQALLEVFHGQPINWDDNFFALGGDSIKAIQLSALVAKLGRESGLSQAKLAIDKIFAHPELNQLANYIQLVNSGSAPATGGSSHAIQQLNRQLNLPDWISTTDQLMIKSGAFKAVAPDNIALLCPLSALQEGILFHHLLEVTGAYTGRYTLDVAGQLDVDKLQQALLALTKRHEALRSCVIHERLTKPVLVVLTHREIEFATIDLSQFDHAQQQTEFDTLVTQAVAQPFDLQADALLRVKLVKLGEQQFKLLVTSHHIVLDGWSVNNLLQELVALYQDDCVSNNKIESIAGSASSDSKAKLAPAIGFHRYLEWQVSQDQQQALDVFAQQLVDFEPVTLKLPTVQNPLQLKDNEQVVVRPELGVEQYQVALATETQQALAAFAKQHHLTVNSIIQTLWGMLVQRYTYSDDVVVGCVTSGRFPEIDGVEQILGSLINTLPVRINASQHESVLELIKQVQNTFKQAEAVGYVSLAEVQKVAQVNAALFDHVLVSDNYPVSLPELNQTARVKGFEFKDIQGGSPTNFDLTILVQQQPDLVFTFEYKPEVYTAQVMQRVASHLENLINQLLSQPKLSLAEVKLLSSDELAQQQSFNLTQIDYQETRSISEMFADCVAEHPDKTALRFAGQTMTYAELDTYSNALALKLLAAGVGKNVVVPLIAQRSFEMMIAIVAINKAGGAYLPIDPSLPGDRIRFLIDDVNASIGLVWQQEWLAQNQDLASVLSVVNLAELSAVSESQKARLAQVQRQDDSLTYVIYTSGSTGKPKGVMLEDKALINRLLWMAAEYNISDADVILQKTTFAFDVSVWEIFLPIIKGVELCLLLPGDEKLPEQIAQTVADNAVTIMHFVPAMLSVMNQAMFDQPELVAKMASLSRCFCSGEALGKQQADDFYALLPNAELHNLYGPTEAAIDVTYFAVKPESPTIPIGKPVANTQLHILDKWNQPVPVGIAGELFLGGVQLARGYLNRPQLTAERFTREVFETGEILYRTGDLACWTTQGEVEYLGRMDDQVKIRGFRIELGEIEFRLSQISQIQDAVVMARKDEFGVYYLVAFYTAESELSYQYISEQLLVNVPSYMVPSVLIALESIPKNQNGKVDRKALAQVKEQKIAKPIAEVENELQAALLEVWQQVLSNLEIGIDDNFFSIRGDSILAIQVASRLQNKGYKLNLEDLFSYPTIRELANYIEPLVVQADQSELTGQLGLNPMQTWFNTNIKTAKHHWNQSLTLISEQSLDHQACQRALQALVAHHDGLRANLLDDQLFINSVAESQVEMTVISAQDQTAQDLATRLSQYQSAFQLENNPLYKFVIVEQADCSHLVMLIHHLLVDGYSWRILVEDFITAYSAARSQQTIELPAKSHSVKDWYQGLLQYSQSAQLQNEQDYWQKVLTTSVNPLIPSVNMPPAVAEGKKLSFVLDEHNSELLLQQANQAFGTDTQELLLAALNVALQQWCKSGCYRVDLEGHGRENIGVELDVSRTVGWFTSLYPVLLKKPDANGIGEIIITTKEHLRKVPNKGVGFGVLTYLTQMFEHNSSDILFNYLGQIESHIQSDYRIAQGLAGQDVSLNSELLYPLEITALIERGALQVAVTFDGLSFEQQKMADFMTVYRQAIVDVINFCMSQEQTQYTPSDFTDDEIDMDDLSSILDAIE